MEIIEKIEDYISEAFKADFITDFGKSLPIKDAKTGKSKGNLPRYGVWGNLGRGKPEVKEVSDDLKMLKKKYGEDLPVVSLKK